MTIKDIHLTEGVINPLKTLREIHKRIEGDVPVQTQVRDIAGSLLQMATITPYMLRGIAHTMSSNHDHLKPNKNRRVLGHAEMKKFYKAYCMVEAAYLGVESMEPFGKILIAEPNNEFCRPGFFVVETERSPRRGCIVVEGSRCISDIFTDLLGIPADTILSSITHFGVYNSAVHVKNIITSRLHLESFDEIDIYGHSLGAATAVPLALLLEREFPRLRINVIGFSCPLVCGRLKQKTQINITTVITPHDSIPSLSMKNLARLARDSYKLIAKVDCPELVKLTDSIEEAVRLGRVVIVFSPTHIEVATKEEANPKRIFVATSEEMVRDHHLESYRIEKPTERSWWECCLGKEAQKEGQRLHMQRI